MLFNFHASHEVQRSDFVVKSHTKLPRHLKIIAAALSLVRHEVLLVVEPGGTPLLGNVSSAQNLAGGAMNVFVFDSVASTTVVCVNPSSPSPRARQHS